LKGSVIHGRLVAEHAGSCQCVKMFLPEARPRIAAELAEGDDPAGHLDTGAAGRSRKRSQQVAAMDALASGGTLTGAKGLLGHVYAVP
jgi:hypothetical protein